MSVQSLGRAIENITVENLVAPPVASKTVTYMSKSFAGPVSFCGESSTSDFQ